MWKKKTEVEPDLVDFKRDNKKCKAKFLPDQLIMLLKDGKEMIIADGAGANIESGKG
jgi:hypothetical protein